jgi:hypothetical protein
MIKNEQSINQALWLNLVLIGDDLLTNKKETLTRELRRQKVLFIGFDKMLKKYSHLLPIKNLTAYKVFKGKYNNKVRIETLSLQSLNKKLVCVLPDFNQTLIDFRLLKVNLTNQTATIKVEGIVLNIKILLSDYGLYYLAEYPRRNPEYRWEEDLEMLPDEIDIDWFEEFKITENNLEVIPKGNYQAQLNGLKTNCFSTPMVNLVHAESGIEYKNVMCNSMLKRILADNKKHNIVIVGEKQVSFGKHYIKLYEKY